MAGNAKEITLHKGEGTARWFLGCLYEFKATGDQTGGALTVMEVTLPPNIMGAPPHVHDVEETAYILEGMITYHIGEKTVDAAAGSFFFFPKGQPEWFENTTDKPARMLITYSPGGFDKFFMEASEPAQSRTLPPRPEGPPDMEKLNVLAKKYGLEILPPKE
jgi:quercetin dioxygenase-like cupin family protein